MTIPFAAPIVCLLGLIMFLWAESKAPPDRPVVSKLGFAMFCCGLLVMLLLGGEHGAKLW